jgi:hypothetical protein
MTPKNDLVIENVPVHGLWSDVDGSKYVSIASGNNLHAWRPQSAEFRRYVRQKAFMSEKSEILGDARLDSIASTFEALCDLNGNEIELSVRVAQEKSGRILIDAIDKIIAVTGDGWEEVVLDYPVFKRFPAMRPLAQPIKGGDVGKVFNYVNINDKYMRILFLTHLIYSFVADRPHPLGVFFGPQGASKSFSMKVFLDLVDSNMVTDTHVASDNDFQVAATQRWCVGLDNVSYISPRFSDYLCKVVTGASLLRRRLYTDDSMIAMKFLRVVLVNGINLPMNKPDLLDRCLLFQLDRIDNNFRIDEQTLLSRYKEDRGVILGGCLDVLSKAMTILPSVTKKFNTRMSDYARWGSAIAQALGYTEDEFTEAIEQNSIRLNEESLDSSPLAIVLEYVFSKTGSLGFKGSATELLAGLKDYAEVAGVEPRYLPSNPHSMGKKLVELKVNLQAQGYFVDFSRGKERLWTIIPPKWVTSKSNSIGKTPFPSFPSSCRKAFAFDPTLSEL